MCENTFLRTENFDLDFWQFILVIYHSNSHMRQNVDLDTSQTRPYIQWYNAPLPFSIDFQIETFEINPYSFLQSLKFDNFI